MVGEAAGLVGASLRRSPALAGEAPDFDFPEIRRWLSFTPDRAFPSSQALVVGVASRGTATANGAGAFLRPIGATGLTGHFHAAAFSHRPLPRGPLELETTVASLFEAEAPRGLLHLIRDDRPASGLGESEFWRGALWAASIDRVTRTGMTLLLGALSIGLILSLLAAGVFISFRVFSFPDITTDGSVTTGASIAAVLIVRGMSPLPATILGAVGGALAGAATGVLHARFKINRLLAGILVMTALYSINLRIMGKSNVPLLAADTLATRAEALGNRVLGGSQIDLWGYEVAARDLAVLALVFVFVIVVALLLWAFLRTQLGTAMRATGNNEQMIRALGVDVGNMQIVGLALANGLVALSGALLAQYQGFADVQMGIGMVVWGLASVIIGEALVGTTQLGLVDHRRGDGLGPVPAAGGDRAARRPRPQRPEAGHRGVRVRRAHPARRAGEDALAQVGQVARARA